MKYLLDTNTCIRYINGRAPQIREHMRSLADTDIVISTVTMVEMFFGSAKSEHPERSRAKQDAFFIRFTHLVYDEAAAEEFGRIRAPLIWKQQVHPLEPMTCKSRPLRLCMA